MFFSFKNSPWRLGGDYPSPPGRVMGCGRSNLEISARVVDENHPRTVTGDAGRLGGDPEFFPAEGEDPLSLFRFEHKEPEKSGEEQRTNGGNRDD